jgi:hypothetical protein
MIAAIREKGILRGRRKPPKDRGTHVISKPRTAPPYVKIYYLHGKTEAPGEGSMPGRVLNRVSF